MLETALKSLHHSCRSELHVDPRLLAAQTIRSPDRSELSSRFRVDCILISNGSGPASYGASRIAPSRDLTPESLRGSRHRDLTLGMARGACTAPVGFHRFEPVDECDRSHSGQFNYPTRNFATLGPFMIVTPDLGRGRRHFCGALHVAVKIGLYHHDRGARSRLACSL